MPLIAQRETLLVYYFLLEFFSNSKAEEGEKRETVMEQNWQIYSEREVNLVRPREEKKKKKNH